MADSAEGRRIHALAEEARERGDFGQALECTDRATLAYQQDGDLLGLAEVQSSRQSTFKHLYRHTNDPVYLNLEKHAAISAVEIAEMSQIPEALGIPYHNLGKYYLEAKEYEKAVDAFQKAADNMKQYPNDRHGRPSVIADIEGHLFAAKYHTGDKSALDRALEALDTLQNSEEKNEYNKNAWISGAHLRIAEMLMKDNVELAKDHLQKAKEIIENDSRLVLRSEQLKKLEQQF